MQISRFFASLGIEIDRASIRKVDTTLNTLEKKLRKFGTTNNIKIQITGFDINQTALRTALGNSLDIASKSVAFEISKFVVNDRNLQAALLRAARRLPPAPPGGGPHPPYPPHPGPYPPPRPGPTPPSPGSRAFRGGFIGGGLSNFYTPALALGLGGYGLSELNQRNQQVVSAQLQSQAVVQQAGGTAEQGTQSFEWLKNQANRIGFNYLDASGDYNKLLSGLTGAGMTVQQGQNVFKGFSELSRVNKLDRTTQSRLFRALSQVAGKDQLMSEELTGQIAEALPGGVSLFAEAYQRQTGKDLGVKGSASIKELLAAMKERNVRGDILTYAAQVAAERAAPSLEAASRASQAEQARYQNSVNDLAVVASNAGVEEGFARIFRTLTAGLSESNGLVTTLAEGFNEATKWADDLLLWPQSFIRALEGKDSLVADWLGKDQTEQLKSDWTQIQALWKDINSISAPSWLPTLEATSKELKSLLDAIARLQGTKDQAKGIIQEEYGKDPSFWGNIKGLAKANWFTFSNTVDALNPIDTEQAGKNWRNWLGMGSSEQDQIYRQGLKDQASGIIQSEYQNDPTILGNIKGITKANWFTLTGNVDMGLAERNWLQRLPSNAQWDDDSSMNTFNEDMKRAQQEDAVHNTMLSAVTGASPTVNRNEVTINIQVDPVTLQNMDVNAQAQQLATQVAGWFEQANVNFPVRE